MGTTLTTKRINVSNDSKHTQQTLDNTGTYIFIPPKALKRSAPTNGDHQKLSFVLVGTCGDVISCHSDAQHKAIIHATETSFVFNLSTQFIWAVY